MRGTDFKTTSFIQTSIQKRGKRHNSTDTVTAAPTRRKRSVFLCVIGHTYFIGLSNDDSALKEPFSKPFFEVLKK